MTESRNRKPGRPSPFHGVSAVIRDTHRHVVSAQLLMAASSLAYTTLLSIIPLLAVSFSIFKAFGGLDKLYATIEPLVLENLAEGASDEAIAQIHRFIGNIHAGALGAGGLVGLIFTCMSLLFSAEKAIHRVWDTPMRRGWFHRISSYWLIITLGPLGLSFALGAGGSLGVQFAEFLPGGTSSFILASALFFAIYKWVPQRPVHAAPAAISAAVTAVIWNLARFGYSLYTAKVLTYSKIYGSLAAVPIILLWIYIMWVIVLVGTAFTATLQRRHEQS